MSDTQRTVTITDNQSGQSWEFPVLSGTMGPDVVDTRSFYKQTGMFTHDPGFTSTSSCESSITYIDGDEGVLLHRGYPIDQLAEKSTFSEVAYLLINGELPSADQLKEFRTNLVRHTLVQEPMKNFFNGFRHDAHPMAIMCGAVAALSAFYNNDPDFSSQEERDRAVYRLIGKVQTLAAMTMRFKLGQPYVYPRNDLRFSEDFLRMCFEVPSEPYKLDPVLVEAMDRIFILHADHEQNASTSTVRLAGSSGASPYACIAAGIASLWGPAHGGANQAVLEMLDQIGDESKIGEYVKKAKDKDDPFRLMGFGHRVYKNYDPRAKVMQESCHKVLEAMGKQNDPKLKLAMKLEKIALEDDYFVQRKLYPNVDFYSGIILNALGFPTEMFTVLFAISRTVGWIAQWKEMVEDPAGIKIGRPRQLFTGSTQRDYVPISQRGIGRAA